MPVIWQHARYLILPPLSRQTVFDLVRPQHLVDVWAITSLLVFVFVPRWTDSATAHVWASLIYAGAAPLIYGGIAGGLALGVSARAGRDTFISVYLFVSFLLAADAIMRGLGMAPA
jgi:hypothetical protein